MAVENRSVERLVGSYHAWATNGASRVPAWLKDLREGGITRFGDLGFPNMKQEAWRFTSVAPIAEGAFELAKPPARIPTLEDIRPFLLFEAGYRLVLLTVFFNPLSRRLSSTTFRVWPTSSPIGRISSRASRPVCRYPGPALLRAEYRVRERRSICSRAGQSDDRRADPAVVPVDGREACGDPSSQSRRSRA